MRRVCVPDLFLASFAGRGFVPKVANQNWLFIIFILGVLYNESLQFEIDRCSPSVDSFRNGGLEALGETFLPAAQVLCLQAYDGDFVPSFFVKNRSAAEASPGVANDAFQRSNPRGWVPGLLSGLPGSVALHLRTVPNPLRGASESSFLFV